jgi:hypothetical protein
MTWLQDWIHTVIILPHLEPLSYTQEFKTQEGDDVEVVQSSIQIYTNVFGLQNSNAGSLLRNKVAPNWKHTMIVLTHLKPFSHTQEL